MEEKNEIMQEERIVPSAGTGQGPPDQEGGADRLEAMHRIAWGLILTCFTINAINLDYILPTIGVLFLYFGSRHMRDENRYFHHVWMLSALSLGTQLLLLIMESTPLRVAMPEWGILLSGTAFTVIKLLLLWNLHRAAGEAYVKINRTPERSSFRGLFTWELLTYLILILLPGLLDGGLLAWIWIIALLCILVSMYKLTTEIGNLPYPFTPAPVKREGIVISASYLSLCVACIFLAGVFGNHTWQSGSTLIPREDTPIRQQLFDLGMPEDILYDLSDETLGMIPDTPLHVEVANYHSAENNPMSFYYEPTDQEYVLARTVYIVQPDFQISVIEHISYPDKAPVWQHGFILDGSFRQYGAENAHGQLLYEKGGQVYEMPIPNFGYGWYSQLNEWDWGWYQSLRLSGNIGYPFGASEGRAYVFYNTYVSQHDSYCYQYMNYAMMNQPFHFPYQSAADRADDYRTRSFQHHTSLDFYQLPGYREQYVEHWEEENWEEDWDWYADE